MATAIAVRATPENRLKPTLLVILMVLYAVAVILRLTAVHLSLSLMVGAQIVAPALFALIHGSRIYGRRGIFVFTAICLAVCNIVENIGVLTGFPFGAYFFTDAMGPKLFKVPLAMGLAYLAIGYSCWTLALLILNRTANSLAKRNVLAAPALAACMMVVWDFSSEPVWSTISHYWIWTHGGPYFGVPLSNFAGWFLADLVIFQAFALFLKTQPRIGASIPQSYWRLAVFSYIVVIAANIAGAIGLFRLPPVSDSAGTIWNAGSIAITSIVVSFLAMGAFALLAWTRISGYSRAYDNAHT